MILKGGRIQINLWYTVCMLSLCFFNLVETASLKVAYFRGVDFSVW